MSEATKLLQILANTYDVEAVFEAGEKTGKHVVGWTADGMSVRLLITDLPFRLEDIELNTEMRGDNGSQYYFISESQRDAMLAALAAKISASDERSRVAQAALFYRRGNPY